MIIREKEAEAEAEEEEEEERRAHTSRYWRWGLGTGTEASRSMAGAQLLYYLDVSKNPVATWDIGLYRLRPFRDEHGTLPALLQAFISIPLCGRERISSDPDRIPTQDETRADIENMKSIRILSHFMHFITGGRASGAPRDSSGFVWEAAGFSETLLSPLIPSTLKGRL